MQYRSTTLQNIKVCNREILKQTTHHVCSTRYPIKNALHGVRYTKWLLCVHELDKQACIYILHATFSVLDAVHLLFQKRKGGKLLLK